VRDELEQPLLELAVLLFFCAVEGGDERVGAIDTPQTLEQSKPLTARMQRRGDRDPVHRVGEERRGRGRGSVGQRRRRRRQQLRACERALGERKLRVAAERRADALRQLHRRFLEPLDEAAGVHALVTRGAHELIA